MKTHKGLIAGVLLLAACGTEQAQQLSGGVAASADAATVAGRGKDPCAGLGKLKGADQLTMLGKEIFCDANLSEPRGQACASCHSPETGFSGPVSAFNAAGSVHEGAVAGRFGNRKPPTAAYAATLSPPLHYDDVEGLFIGGLFFDGRATGWRLGDPAAEQSLQPFLNPAEQALASKEEVVQRICEGGYGELFRSVVAGACDPGADVSAAYDQVGRAISAFEASPAVNRYSSRYDRFLRGEAKLTGLELRGMELFKGKAQCSLCHPADPGEDGTPPLFTDNTFDNLGVPKNLSNPALVADPTFADPGLGGFLATVPQFADLAADNLGKHRVPTLRNVDKRPDPSFVKSYSHNGYFKSLKAIVHFYNTRDALARCEELGDPRPGENCWPAPEVEPNVNVDELGNLGLTSKEEDAVVAFLRTLSDE